MPDERPEHPPLTFVGEEVPTPKRVVLADKVVPDALLESPVEQPVIPLIDAAMDEWKRLVKTDGELKRIIHGIEDLQYRLNRARSHGSSRVSFLRRRAISNVALKRGVRAIPGFKNDESLSKHDMRELSTKLQELIAKHNFVMPPELISEMRVEGDSNARP